MMFQRVLQCVVVGVVLLSTMAAVSAANLVIDGDFSNFDSSNLVFGTEYSYLDGEIIGAGQYTVATDASTVHPDAASYGDHTSGTGKMLAFNGATDSRIVWQQTVSVEENTAYAFAMWISSWADDAANPVAELILKVNGVQVGESFTAPETLGQWAGFTREWNSDSNTSAELTIIDLVTASDSNDFAIDDISFQPVPEPATLALLVLGGAVAFGRMVGKRRKGAHDKH